MTMKMISSTRRTSISGVTFMSDIAPPVFPPPIPIAVSSNAPALQVPASQPFLYESKTLLLPRSRCCVRVMHLRQQSKLAHARRTDAIDRVHDLAIVRPRISAHKDLFTGL